MRREPLVFAFHDNKLYTFERTDRHSASVFGGPLQANLTGCPFGPKPLHLIAHLRSWHIPVLGERFVFDLPLIYGMHYDGCEMSYRADQGPRDRDSPHRAGVIGGRLALPEFSATSSLHTAAAR